MILIRLRRSLPAIAASTVFPASISTENMPALNFSTTFPDTSILSSFGKIFLWASARYLVTIPAVSTAEAQISYKNIFHLSSFCNLQNSELGQDRMEAAKTAMRRKPKSAD